MCLLQLAPHHNQPQVTASLAVFSLHARKHQHPISHWQVAQLCAQVQRQDQVNPEIVCLSGGTIQGPLPVFSVGLHLEEGTHTSNLNKENLT